MKERGLCEKKRGNEQFVLYGFCRFIFTLVRHPFALLIDKQLSRKATLIFQDVLLFELFQETYLILFYFHLTQFKNIPAKTYRSGKLTKRPAEQYAFLRTSQQPISVCHGLKTSSAYNMQ